MGQDLDDQATNEKLPEVEMRLKRDLECMRVGFGNIVMPILVDTPVRM